MKRKDKIYCAVTLMRHHVSMFKRTTIENTVAPWTQPIITVTSARCSQLVTCEESAHSGCETPRITDNILYLSTSDAFKTNDSVMEVPGPLQLRPLVDTPN